MKQEEEKWLKALRESMEEYSVPPQADGWERLEKKIQPAPVAPRRSYYMYTAAAAIALLLIVSSTAIYLLGDKTAEYTQTAQLPSSIEKTNKDLPSRSIPDDLNSILKPHKPVDQLAMKETKRKVSVPEDKVTTERYVLETTPATVEVTSDGVEEPKSSKSENTEVTVKQAEQKEASRPIHKEREKISSSNEQPRKKGPRNWSLGLSAGNSSGFSNIESNAKGFSNARLMYVSPQITSNEAYRAMSASTLKLNHKLPITFGASIRKQISDHFALQSGITYTRLESDLMSGNNSYATYSQTLHYIGIPVKMDYLFYSNRFLTLYLSAGGAVEKCVSGDSKTTEYLSSNQTIETNNSVKVNPLQWSIGGAAGIQFNINKQLGVFAEPGATYFFNDGSDVQTIRKETPFNFNLQVGLRISY